jgi:hypothetical protein
MNANRSLSDGAEATRTRLTAAPTLPPFDTRTLDLVHALARALSSDAELKRHAEVQALAFWLRPTETRRLAAHFASLEGPDAVLVPRGTVFHVPPSNVDTLFVYSWVVSLLVGNRNVVRLSQRLGGVGAQVAAVVEAVLADPAHAAVASGNAFVRYGHDAVESADWSAIADVRVLWGGDQAVNTLRRVPLPSHAIEVVFPDRTSGCALDVAAVAALDSAGRDALADRFANDAFWFDQQACASPRLLVWLGEATSAREVAADFWPRVAAAARRRGVEADAGTVLAKVTIAARAAIDELASRIERVSPEVTVVQLPSLEHWQRLAPGGGLFHEVVVPSLQALGPYLRRRDQTLTVFGVPRAELMAAARHFNGHGIDRLVPVGQALAFHHVWDGYDLFQQFTRRVQVAAAGW